MERKDHFEPHTTLQPYFYEQISEVIQDQKIEVDAHVPFYLVNLLSYFLQKERVLTDEGGSEIPLAILYCQAQQQKNSEKIQSLKYMGDFALFMSGFFPDQFNRKLVDMDYYIAMGGAAYQQLSSLAPTPSALREVFGELSKRFILWVDVIAQVSEKSLIQGAGDLLRLYEKWIRTGSERLKGKLIKEGIIPNQTLSASFSLKQ